MSQVPQDDEADCDDLPSPAEIDDYYLRNSHGKGERKHKLRLRRADHETLTALIDGTDLPANSSALVYQNYLFFQEQIGSVDPAAVYRGIKKLVVVDVSLTRGQDDPQMIFESLNSTGKNLTQADLVRNFVLMRQDEERQTQLYRDYWQPIEIAFGSRYSTHFDRFMRDYLTIQIRPSKPLVSEEVYVRFKEFYSGKLESSVDEVLAELKRFAGYYSAYNFGSEPNPKLRLAFERLRTVVDVASPVILQLYDAYDRAQTVTASELIEAAGLLESYVFRRSVCDLQTRSLGMIFASIALRLKTDSPLNSLKVTLYRQGEPRKFPSDLEFVEALTTRDVYHMRQCSYLLDRLENDSNEKIDTSSFSVEHVMPQNENLRSEWREMLGPDWAQIQQSWLHRLGNVTLTGYNSKYSDLSFKLKREMKDGFNDSPLRINQFLRNHDSWTPREMEVRGKALAQKAVNLWSTLTVDTKLVRAAELEEHEGWAVKYPVNKLSMEGNCQTMFDLIRPLILKLGEDIHELGQSNSVVYRVFDFFVELVPRKWHLTLVLNLDIADVEDIPEGLEDATNYAFIVYAQQRGGILFNLSNQAQLQAAITLVHQAYRKVTD